MLCKESFIYYLWYIMHCFDGKCKIRRFCLCHVFEWCWVYESSKFRVIYGFVRTNLDYGLCSRVIYLERCVRRSCMCSAIGDLSSLCVFTSDLCKLILWFNWSLVSPTYCFFSIVCMSLGKLCCAFYNWCWLWY